MTARLEPPTKGIGIADAFVVGSTIVGQRHVLDVLEMVNNTHPRQSRVTLLALALVLEMARALVKPWRTNVARPSWRGAGPFEPCDPPHET